MRPEFGITHNAAHSIRQIAHLIIRLKSDESSLTRMPTRGVFEICDVFVLCDHVSMKDLQTFEKVSS